MKTWYRLVKCFMYNYYDKFFPELPRELWNVFRKVDIDLGYLRFKKRVLAVHQVDFVLDTVGKDMQLEPQQKMYFKNRLLELGLMVYGFTLGQDNEITRIDKSLVELMETQKRLWNKGRNPKVLDIPKDISDFDASQVEDDEIVETKEERRSWAFPYDSDVTVKAKEIKEVEEVEEVNNEIKPNIVIETQDTFSREQWREIVLKARPDITQTEFDQMWNMFVANRTDKVH